MVGCEPLQAVRAKARDQVLVHVDSVSEVGVLGDVRRRGDVLDPVGEPLADRPPLGDLAHAALVAVSLQSPDLRRDLASALATNMAAVGSAVVPDADRNPTVPVPVVALVD